MLESKIEQYLVKKIKTLKGMTYKFTSPSNSGVPDRIIIYKGLVFFVELKKPGGKLRPLQKKVIKDLKAQGITVEIISTKEEVNNFAKKISKGIGKAYD